jgi:membrane protease YdiL (CAAX protease family)
MSDLEHNILGGAFALCAAVLYLVAFPVYVLRHVGPGKPPPLPTGKVSIAGFGLIDFVGVSMFFGFYAVGWIAKKSLEEGLAGEADPEAPILDASLLLGNIAFQGVFVLVVIALLCWRMNLVKAWGLKWRGWPWVFLYVPAVIILIYGVNLFLYAYDFFEWAAEAAGKDPDKPTQDAVRLLQESSDPLTIFLMAWTACVGAPLMEELVFRGYIYPAVKRFANIPVAVLFSGILFGAVHLDLASFLPLTIFGILLALLYERTGSLWAPLATHFAFNSLTVSAQLLSRLYPELLEEAEKNAAFIRLW